MQLYHQSHPRPGTGTSHTTLSVCVEISQRKRKEPLEYVEYEHSATSMPMRDNVPSGEWGKTQEVGLQTFVGLGRSLSNTEACPYKCPIHRHPFF